MKFNDVKDIVKQMKPVQEGITLPNIEGEFNKYKVPINFLKFNPYNDRFAKEILTYNAESKNDIGFDKVSQDWLFSMLLNIDTKKNSNTRSDIFKNGLMREIVVDINGVVLDGNRRVSILKDVLLNKKKKYKDLDKLILESFENLKVVVVEQELSKEEIHLYETKLQISEDEKMEYDPINIYLKVQRLFTESLSLDNDDKYKDVAEKMGVKYAAKDIKDRIETFGIMKEYLNWAKQPVNYNLLEKREDSFKNVASLMRHAKKKSLKLVGLDINFPTIKRIKDVLFTFISAQYEGKKFRLLVPTNKSTNKTPLSTATGLKKIEEQLLKYDITSMPIIKEKAPEAIQVKLNNSIKSASKEVEKHDPSLQIKDVVTKLGRRVADIEDWANRLIGGSSIPDKVISDIQKETKKLSKILERFDYEAGD